MTIEVVIYLCDNSSKKFLLENGRSLTTVQFFELMLNALDLKDKQLATKCFSLWLKSPLLGRFISITYYYNLSYAMFKKYYNFLFMFL